MFVIRGRVHVVFLFQLISDAGYQGEITSVSTACHQLEVFSRVLKTSVSSYLSDTDAFLKNNMQDFAVSDFSQYFFSVHLSRFFIFKFDVS